MTSTRPQPPRPPGGCAELTPDPPMEFIGLRVPRPKIDHLDVLAGDTKGGRSGVIRAAIDEYLERHPLAS